jgi:hypothetical protein
LENRRQRCEWANLSKTKLLSRKDAIKNPAKAGVFLFEARYCFFGARQKVPRSALTRPNQKTEFALEQEEENL